MSINSRLFVGSDAVITNRLIVMQDVSLNANIVIAGSTLIMGNLAVQQYKYESIINTTTMKIRLKDLQFKNSKGIYAIKNIATNQIYIGSVYKATFYKRFKQHLNGLIKNKHENSKLQNSYNKYGEENFEFYIVDDLRVLELKDA